MCMTAILLKAYTIPHTMFNLASVRVYLPVLAASEMIAISFSPFINDARWNGRNGVFHIHVHQVVQHTRTHGHTHRFQYTTHIHTGFGSTLYIHVQFLTSTLLRLSRAFPPVSLSSYLILSLFPSVCLTILPLLPVISATLPTPPSWSIRASSGLSKIIAFYREWLHITSLICHACYTYVLCTCIYKLVCVT